MIVCSNQAQTIRVVNMIPQNRSGERSEDSEPNLAVNPQDVNQIAGSAFTPSLGFCAPNTAPIFVSADGGNTWLLNCIVPSNAAGTGTDDITLRFGSSGNRLYAGILRRPGDMRLNILRTNNFLAPDLMTVLVDRQADQPYVQAITIDGNDRVYVGNNDFNAALQRTATIDQSLNGEAVIPAGGPLPPNFVALRLESRATLGQDWPPIRPSIARDGTVYAAFYGRRVGFKSDVVVVRDDRGGTGPAPFTDLRDPVAPAGDGEIGRRVITGRNVPFEDFSHDNFGHERLVASNLSIAVDPNASSIVYVAWADRVGTEVYTLHVRRSTDRGANWTTGDLRTITNATNPALAINSAGKVGFLFQKLEVTGGTQRWVTHLERTTNAFATVVDLILADTPAAMPPNPSGPYLGDYIHLMTIDRDFFGIFSANNTPDRANFPHGVTYQRNANFQTRTLLDTDNVTPVDVSIDPFFFNVLEPFRVGPCQSRYWLCTDPVSFEKELIVLQCLERGCRAIDPLARNCLVKFGCPWCSPSGLCPAYFNIFMEGLEEAWNVSLVNPKGERLSHKVFKTPKGVVLTFRPSKGSFDKKSLADYILVFQIGPNGKLGSAYKVKMRLEAGDRPYSPNKRND